MNRRARGSKYEQAAADYLGHKGYQVLATNYRYSRTEIDIICSLEDVLIFVEVKGQRSAASSFGDARYRVDQRKQEAIVKTAQGYIAATPARYQSYRFDVIIVTDNAGEYEIEHIENAFNA